MKDIDSAGEDRLSRDLQALGERSAAAPPYLQQRILANLPEREPAAELLAWLRGSAWRLATAAALPLAFGFVMGAVMNGNEVGYNESIVYAEIWEAYEINEL